MLNFDLESSFQFCRKSVHLCLHLSMDKIIDRSKLGQFGTLELLAKQVVEGFITGMHKSPYHGFSVEFAEHRLYNTGESTRHIDWKLYGRSEKLFTKKYEEETNLRCQIVVDCSSSMFFPKGGDPDKYTFSVYAAASLIELLRRQRDAVGISLFTNELIFHSASKSSVAHLHYLYHELEKNLGTFKDDARKGTDTTQTLHAIADRCHRRSLIILFTDLLDDPSKIDELFGALQHMKHNKHEIILFHVAHKKTELDFTLEDRPYELIDMESGEHLKIRPEQIKEQYLESIRTYFEEIKLRCANYRIDFMPANIEDGYNSILLKYLLKRQKIS
jgi:uncharacterized protein (DUF58 family)